MALDLDLSLVRVKDDPVRVNSLSPPVDPALRNDPQRFDDGERLNSTGFVQLLLLVPLVDRLRPRELGRESLTMIYVVSAQDVLGFQDAEIPKIEAKGLPSFLLEIPTPNRLPTLRKARCNELQSNDIYPSRIRERWAGAPQLLAGTTAI